MSDEPPLPLLPNPTLRFRMHTLLGVTGLVAVLAAMAGPFYRAQAPASQNALLAYWSALGIFSAIGVWAHLRKGWRASGDAGTVRFFAWSCATQRQRPWSLFKAVLMVVSWTGLVAAYSNTVAVRAAHDPTTSIWLPLFQGMVHGMLTGGALIAFVRTPVLLCENGVAFHRGFAPWRYISNATWLSAAHDMMKLRRFDGDIFNCRAGARTRFARGIRARED